MIVLRDTICRIRLVKRRFSDSATQKNRDQSRYRAVTYQERERENLASTSLI